MVPPNLVFWSNSRKESLTSQQKHALEIVFCKHYCVQMTLLVPGTIGKCSLEITSILDGVCFTYEQLFHPVFCTACRICHCSSIDKLVLPRATGILTISDQLHHICVMNCFGNGTRQYSTCLYQFGSLHILSTIIFCPI